MLIEASVTIRTSANVEETPLMELTQEMTLTQLRLLLSKAQLGLPLRVLG